MEREIKLKTNFDLSKVLVVDDELLVRQLLKRCLKPVGLEAVSAKDGQEALDILEVESFGIIILDLMMPGIHGLEVLSIIQQRWSQIKVIILTANATLEMAIKALRNGAYDFVAKPFSVDQIRATVQRAIEKLRLEMRFAAVYDLSQEMGLSRSIDQVAEKVFDIVGSGLELGTCQLFLRTPGKDELVMYDVAYSQGDPSPIRLSLSDQTSVVATAARQAVPVHIPDLERDSRYVATYLAGRSELAVPLVVRGKVIGVLDATSSQPSVFSPDDVLMLSTLAGQAAVAIENARLYERISLNLAEWRVLGEVMLAASSTLDFDEVLSRVLKTIHRALEVEYLNFALPSEDSQFLLVHPSRIGGTASLKEVLIPVEDSLEGRVYTTGEPILVDEMREERGRLSRLAVPVRSGRRVIAILNAEGLYPRAFSEDDLRIFQAIADQLGMVLENTRLYEAERELRRLVEESQARLVQNEKLAATGRMAASLAHEINNPLQAIHNSLQYMLNFPVEIEESHEYLNMANEEVERLMGMTARILDFARPGRNTMQPADVNKAVVRVLALASKYIQHNNIVLHQQLVSELPHIMAAPDELVQIFMNLVMNAVEAMPGGGELYVQSALTEDEGIEVIIRDTGQGISPDHFNHIFEPFYSTKESGTGLGLAVSHNLIQRHGGEITVESEPGKGATFTVWFPALPA